MTVGRDLLSKAETVTVAVIGAGVLPWSRRAIIADFHLMIRRKAEEALTDGSNAPWPGIVASFAGCGATIKVGILTQIVALHVEAPKSVSAYRFPNNTVPLARPRAPSDRIDPVFVTMHARQGVEPCRVRWRHELRLPIIR
jgi:hypothetical protein